MASFSTACLPVYPDLRASAALLPVALMVHPSAQGLWGKLAKDLLCFSSPQSIFGYCKETTPNSWLSGNVPCLGVTRSQCVTSWSRVLRLFQSREMNALR